MSVYSSPFIVRINRPDPSKEWGFRLYGGRDVGSPISLTHVVPNSLSAKHGLEAGDRVVGIGGDATSAMTHMQAQQAVIRCGNELELAVIRGGSGAGGVGGIGGGAYIQNDYATPLSPSVVSGGGTTRSVGGQQQMKTRSYLAPRSPRQPNFRTHTVVNIGGSRQQPDSPSLYALSPQQHNLQAMPTPAGPSGPSPYAGRGNTCRPINTTRPTAVGAGSYLQPAQAKPYQPYEPVVAPPTRHHDLPVTAATWKPNNSAPSAALPAAPSANFPTKRNNNPISASGGGGGQSGPKRFQPGTATLKNDALKTPMCAVCRSVIRGPFMAALDYTFCPEHFVCSHCNCRLDHCGFVEENGALYCEDDFAKFLAPRCEKCHDAIVGSVVTAMAKKWHPHCFLCAHCGQAMAETTFRVGDDGLPYCEKDWGNLYSMLCDKCSKGIEPIDRYIEAFQKVFHADCFRCAACQISLDGKPFHSRDGKAFCKVHARAAALY